MVLVKIMGDNDMIIFKGKYTTAIIMIDNIEKECVTQIIEMINHPAFINRVVIMPDAHLGIGSVIGFTMALGNKIIPNTVGSDIDCGMLMMILDLRGEINVARLEESVRNQIPFGQDVRETRAYDMEKKFPWREASELNMDFCKTYNKKFDAKMVPTVYNYEWFEEKCNSIGMNVSRAVNSIGSVGGGNHFIEFGNSKIGNTFNITIHSGSRQFGKKICEYWQATPTRNRIKEKNATFAEEVVKIKNTLKGVEISKAIKKLKSELRINNKVEKSSMNYIEGEDMEKYLTDMTFCQIYAKENRRIIGQNVIRSIDGGFSKIGTLETIHNYVDFKDFIIRKGAVSAHKNELFILPFNMEDGILICEGKGNSEWNFSAPHGAGRLFSRTKAKEKFSSEAVGERMKSKGIYTTSVPTDEVKEAYKDPEVIKSAIKPTAKIIDVIKPMINIKERKDGNVS